MVLSRPGAPPYRPVSVGRMVAGCWWQTSIGRDSTGVRGSTTRWWNSSGIFLSQHTMPRLNNLRETTVPTLDECPHLVSGLGRNPPPLMFPEPPMHIIFNRHIILSMFIC